MDYQIIEGLENMEIADIVRLLHTTYWAKDRPVEDIDRAVSHSRCVGIRLPGDHTLAAFARVISDGATMFYLSDVVVDEAWRGRGLGTALVSHIVSLPDYRPLRGFLITQDAHGLYRKFGFETATDRVMVRTPKG
ncbi:MAG: GNAT family N-acetyltransferase [Clostridia bacterium]|nr:GNAT family N-acetyltransferase [Clostridia bacterium]